jgi:probable O-glycosylation ligase (exosortase A-associated)
MRDLVVFAIVFGALPFALVRPYYGLLLYSWLAFMRAPDLCWGPAKSFRFSLIVAAVMYGGWLLFDKRPFMRADRRNTYMLLLSVCVTISFILAPNQESAVANKYTEFLKVIAVAVFATAQLDTKSRVQQMVWVAMLSFAFYGVKGGVWGLLLQDARIIRGPGGLLLDNNDFSLAMVMNLPFLFYLATVEERPKVKLFLRGAFVLTIMTIALTGSRGGFLAMATACGAMVLKSRYKAIGIGTGIFGAALFFALIPQDYRDRLMSIKTAAKEDASAIGRLQAWSVALEMIADKPLFGVGFQNFVSQYGNYEPSPGAHLMHRVTHNSYLQIWAESGTFAFVFFLAVLFSTILLCRRLQRTIRVRDGPPWIHQYAAAIEVTFYGFLMGAMFLNRAHFDFIYMMSAIAIALAIVTRHELAAQERATRVRRGAGELVVAGGDPFVAGRIT